MSETTKKTKETKEKRVLFDAKHELGVRSSEKQLVNGLVLKKSSF